MQKECRENLQLGAAEKLRGDLREEWSADLRGKNTGRSIGKGDEKNQRRSAGNTARRFTQKECRKNHQLGATEKLRDDLREEWSADLRGKNAGRSIGKWNEKNQRRSAGNTARRFTQK